MSPATFFFAFFVPFRGSRGFVAASCQERFCEASLTI